MRGRLARARRAFACETAIYVGDDETDGGCICIGLAGPAVIDSCGQRAGLASPPPPPATGRHRRASPDVAHGPGKATCGRGLAPGPMVTVVRETGSADDSLWYKDAIIYALHVKTFFDGNGDGIGDFVGLIETLGYEGASCPPMTPARYRFTLGPHACHWLSFTTSTSDGLIREGQRADRSLSTARSGMSSSAGLDSPGATPRQARRRL